MPHAKKPDLKQVIIIKAKELFWQHGVKRVTVAEICEEAGVSKMTFYRSFKNKEEVAGAVIDALVERGRTEYNKIMQGTAPFPEKVQQLLNLKQRESAHISKAFVEDLYRPGRHELSEKLDVYRVEQVKQLRQDLADAQRDGWIRKELSLDFVMYMLHDLDYKIKDQQLMALYTNADALIMDLTNYFFHGILTPNQQP